MLRQKLLPKKTLLTSFYGKREVPKTKQQTQHQSDCVHGQEGALRLLLKGGRKESARLQANAETLEDAFENGGRQTVACTEWRHLLTLEQRTAGLYLTAPPELSTDESSSDGLLCRPYKIVHRRVIIGRPGPRPLVATFTAHSSVQLQVVQPAACVGVCHCESASSKCLVNAGGISVHPELLPCFLAMLLW